MNKHHREDHEMKHGARHREKPEGKKKMSHGGMVGEKVRKSSGSEGSSGEWGSVHAMLTGKHPTTNLATNKCGGNKSMKMAAGGVGKMRHEAYD